MSSTLVETLEDEVPTVLVVAKFIGDLQQLRIETIIADSKAFVHQLPGRNVTTTVGSMACWYQGAAGRTELAVQPLVADAEALLERGQHVALLARLLEQAPILFARAEPKDAECCFLVMANIVPRLPHQEALEAAAALCIALSAEMGETAPLRLRVLLALFNLLQTPYSRYTVLLRVLAYAGAAGLANQLVGMGGRVGGWIKEWNLGPLDARVLLLAVANLFQAAGPSGARDHLAFLSKYLATFQAGDAELTSDTAREAVVRAAVEFIGASDLFQCDLLDLPAVAACVNHPTAGPVLALLETMLTGKLADLTARTAANPKLLPSLNLSADAVMTKMRLLSLAALGAEADAGEVPYATIKATLQLQEGEVEGWVVKAIGVKLLEAKMDQLREVVVFSRCTQRVFADAQWQELRAKLSAWKENLGGVCSMVQHTRLTGPTQLVGSHEAMPLPLR